MVVLLSAPVQALQLVPERQTCCGCLHRLLALSLLWRASSSPCGAGVEPVIGPAHKRFLLLLLALATPPSRCTCATRARWTAGDLPLRVRCVVRAGVGCAAKQGL